jgi:hypothetical protein
MRGHIWLTIYPSNKCDYKKNYINKRCTKMGGSKNAKEPNEKMVFL